MCIDESSDSIRGSLYEPLCSVFEQPSALWTINHVGIHDHRETALSMAYSPHSAEGHRLIEPLQLGANPYSTSDDGAAKRHNVDSKLPHH